MSPNNLRLSLPTFYYWNDVYSTQGLFERGDDLTCNFVLYIEWINDKFKD